MCNIFTHWHKLCQQMSRRHDKFRSNLFITDSDSDRRQNMNLWQKAKIRCQKIFYLQIINFQVWTLQQYWYRRLWIESLDKTLRVDKQRQKLWNNESASRTGRGGYPGIMHLWHNQGQAQAKGSVIEFYW